MREEAIVEIFGRLVTDLVISKAPDGTPYGEVIMAVYKSSSAHVMKGQEGYQTTYVPVFIWDEEVLENDRPLFVKGLKVILIGELELLDRSYNLMHNRIDDYLVDKTIVVSIKRNRAIKMISNSNR